MTTTIVRTYRLSHALDKQVALAAEKERTTAADIVRTALAEFFDRRQQEAALLGLEQRIVAHLNAHTQHLSAGLQKILSMAEPVQG